MRAAVVRRGVVLAALGSLLASGGEAAAQTRPFSIGAQPLPAALNEFSRASGLQVSAPAELTTGRGSPGVSGVLAPNAALARLLAGAGLTGRIVGGTVVLAQAATAPVPAGQPAPPTSVRAGQEAGEVQLPTVSVEATRVRPSVAGFQLEPEYAGGQVARGGRVGLLGNLGVFDTPFSTSNYTRETIVNQNAQVINDVLLNEPAVRLGSNRFSDSEIRTIRGFTVNGQNTTFLGLPGIVDFRRPRLEGIERVELLEGPNTLLNGAVASSNVGGVVNLVPKRAGDVPTRDVLVSYTSRSLFGGQVDVGQRFGAANEWGARVNLSGRGGSTPIDRQSETGTNGTAALDYRGERLRVSLDLGRQATYLRGESQTFTVLPGVPVPKPPNATRNVVGDETTFRTINSFGVLHAEYDVTSNVSVFASYGLSRIREVYNGGFAPLITDASGSATVFIIPFTNKAQTESSQFGARATFDTGPVSHRLTLATDRFDQVSAFNFAFTDSYETNIYRPTRPPLFANPDFDWNPSRSTESKRISYAVADTLSVLDGRIQLTAGGRLQYIDERSFDPAGETATRYRQSRTSPAVALVVKPVPGLSLYGNYIEQLNQGDTAPLGTVNAGTIFAPYVSVQKEVGVKYDFGRIAVTAALFEITQPSGSIDASTNTFGVNGEQRNRGFEIKTFGEAYPGVRLLGGVAFIDGRQTKTADGLNDGKRAVAAPVTNVSFGAEWDVPYVPGLTLTGRAIYTTKAYIDAANTQAVPSYARFDIGARYVIDRGPGRGPIVIRGGIDNVGGKDYWQSSTNGITLGTPRTFFLSTSFSL